MNTFAVSSVQIDRLMKKAQSDQNIITKIDKRGMHGNQPQIDNQVKDDIKEFISAFPKYSSHYGREKGYGSSVLMLAPGITKKFVYDEFIKEKKHDVSQKCFEKYWRDNIPVSIHNKTC